MKKYCVCLVVLLLSGNCLSRIKNGYASEIRLMWESLKSLNWVLVNERQLSFEQKADIKGKIEMLKEFITYYELTEELLIQFRSIAPEMYHEIDTITNCDGIPTDVYVKFAPESSMLHGAHGTTNVAASQNDVNLYHSEYGPGTVSVKIASVNKALSLLAHEFGHVQYQVVNLAQYQRDYMEWYVNESFVSKYIGHNTNDKSGQKALEFENTFRDLHLHYKKSIQLRLEEPLRLLTSIRKSVASADF